jgi:hypothetical protein
LGRHIRKNGQRGICPCQTHFWGEPTDPEIYEFVLNHYHELKFGEMKEFTLQIKRMNPKRVQREVRKEMEKLKETSKPSHFSPRLHARRNRKEEKDKAAK